MSISKIRFSSKNVGFANNVMKIFELSLVSLALKDFIGIKRRIFVCRRVRIKVNIYHLQGHQRDYARHTAVHFLKNKMKIIMCAMQTENAQ